MADHFVNPYHFVGLPKEKRKYEQNKDTELVTGAIVYTITTRSPLFIPDTSNDQAFPERTGEGSPKQPDSQQEELHKQYEFFSHEDRSSSENRSKCPEPVIPGSELRGMLRNIFETLTDSCLSSVNLTDKIYKRIPVNYKAGLIEKKNGAYTLWKAESIATEQKYQNIEFREGEKVFYHKDKPKGSNRYLATDLSGKKGEGRHCSGYIIKGERGPDIKPGDRAKREKHRAHIFYLQGGKSEEGELEKDHLAALLGIIKHYQLQEGKEKSEHKPYEAYREALESFMETKDTAYFPVYYSLESSTGSDGQAARKIFLSPACITKETYDNTVEKILKAQGNFQPCTLKEELCQGCMLFGMVGDDNENAKASSLRFSDAFIEKKKESTESYYDDIVTLQNLSGPKIANSEFYLVRPDGADFWTYDYYVKGGNIIFYMPELMGRKYYWHQNKKELPKDITPTNQNKTVRPVRTGITFRGSLYFENITERQLRQLKWILNLGRKKEHGEQEYGYKLGAGKPLGLGSVQLEVVSITRRKLDFDAEIMQIGYREDIETMQEIYDDKTEYENAGFSDSSKVKEQFFLLCDLNIMNNETVAYPYVKNQKEGEGFQWFVNNHGNTNFPKSRAVLKIHQNLECLKKDNMRLATSVPEKRPVEKKSLKQHNHAGKRELKLSADVPYDIKIIKINKNDVDIQLADGQKGKIHRSELGLNKNQKITDIMKEGDKRKVRYKNMGREGFTPHFSLKDV